MNFFSQDPVEVQVLTGPAVVVVLVLELGKVVADVDHLRFEVVALHEEIEELLGVPGLLDLPGSWLWCFRVSLVSAPQLSRLGSAALLYASQHLTVS